MNASTDMRLAIALTGEMLDLIDRGEFEQINRLEQRRLGVINSAFCAPPEQIDAQGACQLRNLNLLAVEKLSLARKAIVLQQAELRNAARVQRAYLDID